MKGIQKDVRTITDIASRIVATYFPKAMKTERSGSGALTHRQLFDTIASRELALCWDNRYVTGRRHHSQCGRHPDDLLEPFRPPMQIRLDDLLGPEARALLEAHLQNMGELSPSEGCVLRQLMSCMAGSGLFCFDQNRGTPFPVRVIPERFTHTVRSSTQ